MLGPSIILVGAPAAIVLSLRSLRRGTPSRPLAVASLTVSVVAFALSVRLLVSSCQTARTAADGPRNFDCTGVGESRTVESFSFHRIALESLYDALTVPRRGNAAPITIDPEAIVSLDDIAEANYLGRSDGEAEIALRLTGRGAVRLAAFSAHPARQHLVVVLDGECVSDTEVRRPLEASFVFVLPLTDDEACALVRAVQESSRVRSSGGAG